MSCAPQAASRESHTRPIQGRNPCCPGGPPSSSKPLEPNEGSGKNRRKSKKQKTGGPDTLQPMGDRRQWLHSAHRWKVPQYTSPHPHTCAVQCCLLWVQYHLGRYLRWQHNKVAVNMTHASLNCEWHIPVSSATFGVGEGPPAVLLAQEGPPVQEQRSTAVPVFGVRRQINMCFHRKPKSTLLHTTHGTKFRCGAVLLAPRPSGA